jgi:hypothetical protein
MSDRPIRDAVQAADYAQAEQHVAEYVSGLSPTASDLEKLAALMRWVRAQSLCATAHAMARIEKSRSEVRFMTAYRDPD